MGLSYEKYKQMKEKGMFQWNTDNINNSVKETSDFLNSVSSQQSGAQKWSSAEFAEKQEQMKKLRNNMEYMNTYAETLKGTDQYKGVKDTYYSLSQGLSQAENWMNNRSGAYSDDWMERVADKTENEVVPQVALKKLEEQQKREKTYGNMSNEELLKSLDADRIPQATKQIYDKLRYLDAPQNSNEKESYMYSLIDAIKDEYAMSWEDAKALINSVYEGKTDKNSQSYQSMAAALKSEDGVSADDRAYIINRIIENGTVEELQSLYKQLPISSKYDNELRKQVGAAIEAKGEEQYYHDIVKNDPEAADIIENYYDSKKVYEEEKSIADNVIIDDPDALSSMRQSQQEYEGAYEEAEAAFKALKDKGYDTEKMEKYYTRYRERLEAEKQNKELAEWTAQNPVNAVLGSIASIPMNMVGSIGDAVRYSWAEIDKTFGGGDGYIDPATTVNKKVQVVRDTVTQMIGDSIDNDTWRGIAQFLYGTLMSGGDMLAAAVVDKIPIIGSAASKAMFFSSAGVSAANEVLENGGTLDQAVSTMLSHGLNELLFESVSLEQLKAFKAKNPNSVKRIFSNLLKQTITEGSEEVFTDIANNLADAAINGDLSRLQRAKQQYIDSGMSEKEAENQVKWDLFGDTLQSFAGGALMGGVLGGAQGAYAYGYNKRITNDYYRDAAAYMSKNGTIDKAKKELIKQAENSTSKKAVKMAESFNRTIERSGGKLSSITEADVANLMQVLDQEAGKTSRFDTSAADSAINAETSSANTAQTENSADTAAETAQDSAKVIQTENDIDAKKTAIQGEINNNYDNAGNRVTESNSQNGGAKIIAFGKRHPNGLSAIDSKGVEHTVTRIESSSADYGHNDNVVVFKTADGKYLNASEVRLGDSAYNQLANLAANLDTLGARAMLAYYERFEEQNKLPIKQYGEIFEELYKAGRTGVTYENAQRNPRLASLIRTIGFGTGQAAIETGYNDVQLSVAYDGKAVKKVRMPGESNSGNSRVYVESGVTVEIPDTSLQLLQAIAVKTGKDIRITDRLGDGVNGMYAGNQILISENVQSDYMIAVALHEAVHGAKVYAPQEYRALEEFVVNYLTAKGKDIDLMLADIAVRWGENAPSRAVQLEELVCQTVMAVASDENALVKAIETEKNKHLLKQVRDALRGIVERVRKFFDGLLDNKKHNPEARAALDDVAALEKMAKKISAALEASRKNEEDYGRVENEKKYSIEYLSAKKNEDILALVDKVEKGDFKNSDFVELGRVNEKQGSLIEELTGINPTGFKMVLEARQIDHILKRHGKNGRGDHSMSDNNDIAKMEYILQKYDHITKGKRTTAYKMFKNGKNHLADTVLYEKVIGDKSYYLVQAIVDTKAKSVYVVTAYIGKSGYKKETSQFTNAKIPGVTSEIAATKVSDNSISQSKQNDNSKNKNLFEQGDIDSGKVDLDSDSSVKYAIDDTITDDLWVLDDYLFEEDSRNALESLDMLIEQSPEDMVIALYNGMSKAAKKAIQGHRRVRLTTEDYQKVARRVMKRYAIQEKYNKGASLVLSERIEKFAQLLSPKNKTDFVTALDLLVKDCKEYITKTRRIFTDPMKDKRKDIVSQLHGKTLILPDYAKSEVLEDFGGIKNLRRRFFGYVNIATDQRAMGPENAIYMDDVISYVQEHYPELITDECDSIQGFQWLDSLLHDVLQPQFYNPYYEGGVQGADATAIDMTVDIMNELIEVKTEKAVTMKKTEEEKSDENKAEDTLTDADRKMIRELAEIRKRNAKLRSAYYKAKTGQYKKALEQEKERWKNTKNKMNIINEDTAVVKAFVNRKMRNVRQQYIESREKNEYLHRLGKEFNRMLYTLDGKEKKNEYIPDNLKKPILNVLRMFDVEPLPTKGRKDHELPKLWGRFNDIDDIGARVQTLANEYARLKSRGEVEKYGVDFDVNSLAYDAEVRGILNSLAEMVRGKNIFSLNSYELKAIYHTMRELDTRLKKSVEIIIDGRKMMLKEAAKTAVGDIDRAHFDKGDKNVLKWLRDTFVATSLDPVRYGRFLSGYHDDSVVAKVFHDLHTGDQNRVKIMQKAFLQLQKTLSEFSNRELRDLQRKDIEEFEFTDRNSGKRIKISDGMLLSIYLTARQADGYRHLVNDKANHYTKLPDLGMMNVAGVPVLGDTVSSLIHAKEKAQGDNSHEVRFTEADIREISAYVEGNKKLLKLGNTISEVFNGLIKDEINKVSMQREGRLLATVNEYFPLRTDSNDPKKHFENEFDTVFKDARMKSRGFTKQRTFSYTAIAIDDVLNVFARHVQQTAEYCGLIIPIENFKKIYNSGTDTELLRGAIERKFGGRAQHYIEKLMEDIQKPKSVLDENLLTRIHGNYMGAVLMVNPGSALKQFAMYPMANEYFGVKNVSSAAVNGIFKGKKLVEKYSEYTPYMWYREQGNGTIVAETSKQMGLTHRVSDKLDIMGKVDRCVVNSVLFAAEQHVKKTTNLEYDSEAFKKEVARQFEKCIDEIQPNNMVTSKPQFVRNNTLRMLSMNAFVSQNMAMGNCIMDSYMEWRARHFEYKKNQNAETKEANKKAKLKFVRKMLGVVESGALLGVLSTVASVLIFHRRDELKDEKGMYNIWNALGAWADDSLESIAGAFVWGDKLYEVISGMIKGDNFFELEVMSISTINDIITAINNKNYFKAVGVFADAAGVPLLLGSNVQRIGRSAHDYFVDLTQSAAPFAEYSIVKNNGALDVGSFGYYVVHEIKKGNVKRAQGYIDLWKNELKNDGKTDEEATEAIKKKLVAVLADEEGVVKAAVAFMNGEYQTYDSLVNQVAAIGFDSADVVKGVKQVISDIKKDLKDRGITDREDIYNDLLAQGFSENGAWNYAAEWENDSDDDNKVIDVFADDDSGKRYSYDDALDALASGDTQSYELIRDYFIEHKKKADAEEFDKELLKKNRTYPIWKDYVKGQTEAIRNEARRKLVNIYGSESAAREALAEYAKQQEEKQG